VPPFSPDSGGGGSGSGSGGGGGGGGGGGNSPSIPSATVTSPFSRELPSATTRRDHAVLIAPGSCSVAT